MDEIPLCHVTDVPEGSARGFLPSQQAPRRVIVVRRAGKFHAWVDSCPHYAGGTPMAWRKDAYLNGAGTHIACHAHGALFEIQTGECILGPCLGRRLTRVPLRVDADGGLHVPARLGRRGDGKKATQNPERNIT